MNKVMGAAAERGIDKYNNDFCFSDHASSIFPLKSDIDILSWNILTKCRFKDGRTNNSYNIFESDEEYRARLLAVAGEIKRKLQNNGKIAIIALQEAPKIQELLTLLLPEAWQIAAHQETDGISSATATFYDSSRIKLAPANLPQLAADATYDSALSKQRGRYHVLKTGDIILVNAHFRTEKVDTSSQFTIVSHLLDKVKEKMLIVGDFNDRLELFAGRKLINTGGGYKNTKKQGAAALSLIDMAVYNYDPADIK